MRITDGSPYLEEIRALIVEYAESLHRDLSFQNLTEELGHLADKYTGPNGRFLAALSDDGGVIGCVAYRRHSPRRCEMKRLYVKPQYRKQKAGEMLIESIIAAARQDGYEEMVLDTLAFMKSAISLYRKFGFEEIAAYYNNPMQDAIYMRLQLRP